MEDYGWHHLVGAFENDSLLQLLKSSLKEEYRTGGFWDFCGHGYLDLTRTLGSPATARYRLKGVYHG